MSSDRKPNEPISKEEWHKTAWQFEAMIARNTHPKNDVEAAKRLPEGRAKKGDVFLGPHIVDIDWLYSFTDSDGLRKCIVWDGNQWKKTRI